MQQDSSTDTPAHWDLIIRPRKSLLDINFRELWHYRDLMWLFVRRDFVAQYKQTILGPLWHFIQPLFTTAIYLLIFGKIAQISTDGIPPILFYLSGITLWNYFASCLTGTSNTFVANAGIFGKVYFPRLVIPVSVVLSNLVRLGIQCLLLFLAMGILAIQGKFVMPISSWLLALPLLLLVLAGFGLGAGILISSLTTKYRDLTVLVGFAVQLFMYATPVVYPASVLAGSSYAWIIQLNPLTPIVEIWRLALLGQGSVSMDQVLYSSGILLLLLVIGIVVFNQVEQTFMDTV